MTDRWEYETVERGVRTDEAEVRELNSLGEKGWELAGVDASRFWLKRRLAPEKPVPSFRDP